MTTPALRPSSLITATELVALRESKGSADLRILDATTFLHTTVEGAPYTATTGLDAYLAEHIPGSLFADIPGALSDPDAAQLFTVPSPERFAEAVQHLGIGNGTQVVAYDTAGSAWATRLWWLFRYFGHDQVAVLDGGLGAWKAAGLPLASGASDVDAVGDLAVPVFSPRIQPHLLATRGEVAVALPGAVGTSNSALVLVNALDPATFAGTPTLSPYSRRGRIPGSVNLPLYTLLDSDTGRFLPVESLVERLQAQGILDAQRVVTYCGGGIAATLPAFAAYYVAGVDVAVYDGSLSEWTADMELPVEVG